MTPETLCQIIRRLPFSLVLVPLVFPVLFLWDTMKSVTKWSSMKQCEIDRQKQIYGANWFYFEKKYQNGETGISKLIRDYYVRVLNLGLRIMSRLYLPILEESYGRFDRTSYKQSYHVSSRGGSLSPELVCWLKPFSNGKSMLFAGEPSSIKKELQSIFSTEHVTTTGLEGCDIVWNFENHPPMIPDNSFDIVYSHAMLEHIVNPFEHMLHLCAFVKPGGYLGVLAASFLCPYHRHPVHTMNIFPDLIEIVAERSGMNVVKRRYYLGIITYLLEKKNPLQGGAAPAL